MTVEKYLSLGSWQSTPSKIGFELPPVIGALFGIWDSIINFVLSILDLTLGVLDVIKSFMLDFIDPILALLKEFVSQIEGYIIDIRKIGVYFTSDFPMIKDKPPRKFENLWGGYSGFENRMIKRFIDKSDLSRPEISKTSSVIAIYSYMSSIDLDSIDDESAKEEDEEKKKKRIEFLQRKKARLINRVNDIKSDGGFTEDIKNKKLEKYKREIEKTEEEISKLTMHPALNAIDDFIGMFTKIFGVEEKQIKYLPTPLNINYEYKREGNLRSIPYTIPNSKRMIESDSPVDSIKVTWDLSKPLYDIPYGFILEVSTIKGLNLYCERKSPNGDVVKTVLINDPGGYNPYVLMGGSDIVEINDVLGYGEDYEINVYAGSENIPLPIPISLLADRGNESNRYFLQRSFFIKTEDMFPTFLTRHLLEKRNYSYTIKLHDLPKTVGFKNDGGTIKRIDDSVDNPKELFIRIFTVSSKIESMDDLKFVIDEDDNGNPRIPINLDGTKLNIKNYKNSEFVITPSDIGKASDIITVSIPSQSARSFVDLVSASLAVLVLSRSDLPIKEIGSDSTDYAIKATGLEEFSPMINKILLSDSVNDFFKTFDPEDINQNDVFRKYLSDRISVVASDIYDKVGGNESFEKTIVERCRNLLEWTFPGTRNTGVSDITGNLGMTINDWLDYHDIPSFISKNPYRKNDLVMSAYNYAGVWYKIGDREPNFDSTDISPSIKTGSADSSPGYFVKKRTNAEYVFCRNVFLDEIYREAKMVLGSTISSKLKPYSEREWKSITLESIGPFGVVLDEWMINIYSFLGASSSIVKIISEYIEALENKIREIQDAISSLQFMLDSWINISIPANANVLLTVSNGSDGVLSSFLNSFDKPVDPERVWDAEIIGIGGCALIDVVPGPIMDIIIELFNLIISD